MVARSGTGPRTISEVRCLAHGQGCLWVGHTGSVEPAGRPLAAAWARAAACCRLARCASALAPCTSRPPAQPGAASGVPPAGAGHRQPWCRLENQTAADVM